MPIVSLHIDGEAEVALLAARLRQAADAGLSRELHNRMTTAVQSLPQDARRHAKDVLPHRGGLNTWLMERTTITQPVESSGDTVTVRTIASSTHAIDRIDGGTVRHPLFGDKRHWYTQSVTPGWWSKPVAAVTPKVETNVEAAVEAVARQIDQ